MHSNIIARRIHSSLFTYSEKSKSFVTEMSTLQANRVDPLGQFYNDACDAGFLLVSSKTGVAAGFTLHEEVRNNEQELTHWVFHPVADALRRNPGLEGTTVVVFNT